MARPSNQNREACLFVCKRGAAEKQMAEWFFRKKSKAEVERDPGWDEYFTSNRSTEESLVREAIQNSLDEIANQWKDDAE